MRIEVRLYATLRRYALSAADGVLNVDVPEGSKVAHVIANLGVNADEVHIVMVNGVSSPLDQVLAEGDRLGLFPPVGGG
ncbi:MAG TPA: thiamine S protein [Nitrospiraceae bacterium]|jgi:sulfur carrier protein ThiS|nr:thiamine S protein [Nitrospiraceae bacterium]